MSQIYLHLNGTTFQVNNYGIAKETFNSPLLSSLSGLFISPDTDTYSNNNLGGDFLVGGNGTVILGQIAEVDGVKALKCFSNSEKAPETAYEELLDLLVRNFVESEYETTRDKDYLRKRIRLVNKPTKVTVGTEYPTTGYANWLPEENINDYVRKTPDVDMSYRTANIYGDIKPKPQLVLNVDYYFEIVREFDNSRFGDTIPLEYYDNLAGKLNYRGIPVNPEHYRLVAQGYATEKFDHDAIVMPVETHGAPEIVIGR